MRWLLVVFEKEACGRDIPFDEREVKPHKLVFLSSTSARSHDMDDYKLFS